MPSPRRSEYEAIEATISDVRALVRARSYHSAALRMGELRRNLERHLDLEDHLVAIFVDRTGDPGGLTVRLRAEHHEIPAHLEAACTAVSDWDGSKALRLLDALSGALEAHRVTEARLVHPALEDLLPGEPDWDALRGKLLTPIDRG